MVWDINPNMRYFSMLKLRNFRGFKKSDEILLAPLTFLVGPNSSGKSSIFNAILLLAQSRFSSAITSVQRPSWSGPLVDLGSYLDAVYHHNPNYPIEIIVREMPWVNSRSSRRPARKKEIESCFGFRTTKGDLIGKLASVSLTDVKTQQKVTIRFNKKYITIELLGKIFRQDLRDLSSRLKEEIQSGEYYHFPRETSHITNLIDRVLESESHRLKGYKTAWQRLKNLIVLYRGLPINDDVELVASGRAAPRRWYSIAELAGTSRMPYYGARVYRDVDPKMLSEPVDDSFFMPRRKRKYSFTLKSALEKLNIASSLETSQMSAYHSTINVQDNVTGVKSNLIDVGYGASQVIPILRACTSPSYGPLFIEQPEIHLHPQAQATLSELLGETSRERQVIVETHSVHMINRARILIANGDLPPDHVMINFISRTEKGSQVHPIPLLKNGDFANEWPAGYGFFDERYQDTMRLLHLKNDNRKK